MPVARLTTFSARPEGSSRAPSGEDRPVPRARVAATGRGDRQLLRAAALGEARAWDRLVDTHSQAVWETARSSGLDQQEASQVCDVVWRRLAQSLPLSGPRPLTLWLRRQTVEESERARARLRQRTVLAWDGVERRRQRRASS